MSWRAVRSCARGSTLGGRTDIAEERRPGSTDLWTAWSRSADCGRAAPGPGRSLRVEPRRGFPHGEGHRRALQVDVARDVEPLAATHPELARVDDVGTDLVAAGLGVGGADVTRRVRATQGRRGPDRRGAEVVRDRLESWAHLDAVAQQARGVGGVDLVGAEACRGELQLEEGRQVDQRDVAFGLDVDRRHREVGVMERIPDHGHGEATTRPGHQFWKARDSSFDPPTRATTERSPASINFPPEY